MVMMIPGDDKKWEIKLKDAGTYKLENVKGAGSLLDYTLCTTNEGNVNKILANGHVQYGNPTLN